MPGHEPIVVLYKAATCGACTRLSAIWDTPADKGGDSVVSAMKKVYPALRIFVIACKDMSGKFDENTAPRDMARFVRWFPMVFLIPGNVWDAAMAQLGPKNDVRIQDGVQIMNAVWNGKTVDSAHKYNPTQPAEFARWLRDAMATEDFRKIQSSVSYVPPSISASNALAASVAPAPAAPVAAAPVATPPPTASNDVPSSDACTMRIVARPRR
jgi:hypothetical protein